MTTAKATLISIDRVEQQNVKWIQIADSDYANDSVYGIYDDGSVVDAENYPIEEPMEINEVLEAAEKVGI
jgi:hypothetical protein